MKLILHIGTHKTGTTSIQESLSINRQWLYENGYHYPILCELKNSHNAFARKIASANQQQLEDLRQTLLKSCELSKVNIISSEELYVRIVGNDGWSNLNSNEYWIMREQYIQRMIYILQDFSEIEVFMCLRPVDDFAESLYATKVISSSKNTYDSFEDFLSKMRPAFEYKKHVELLSKYFKNINLIPFNQLSTNLIDNFYKWTKVPSVPVSVPQAKKITPDKRLIYWFSFACKDDKYIKHFNRLRSFVKTQKCSLPLHHDQPLTFFRTEKSRSHIIELTQNFMVDRFGVIEGKIDSQSVALNSNQIDQIKKQFETWVTRKSPSFLERISMFFKKIKGG